MTRYEAMITKKDRLEQEALRHLNSGRIQIARIKKEAAWILEETAKQLLLSDAASPIYADEL